MNQEVKAMAMLLCVAEAPAAAECDTPKDAAKEAAPATKDGATKGSKTGKKAAAAPPKRSKKGKKPKGGHAGEQMLARSFESTFRLQQSGRGTAMHAMPACIGSLTAAQAGLLSASCAAHRAAAGCMWRVA